VNAACAVLADPARADVPVLTIAHESGFASLGPFNRAFRDITGQSPSEYRAAALAGRRASP
jgi:AraC-like DNA-binding protein